MWVERREFGVLLDRGRLMMASMSLKQLGYSLSGAKIGRGSDYWAGFFGAVEG
jgi:hypothetical protein